MLGPAGRIAKAALTSAGYELYRATDYEKRLIRSYWADWLSKDPALFARVYERNRKSLGLVDSWTDDIDDSLWRYGVPQQWSSQLRALGRTVLDEIEPEVTYTDLIGFIASGITPLKYLEIGVSVGKNFWQIVEMFPEAEIVGLDVEKPNASLVRLFDRIETVWTGPQQVVDTLSGKPATVNLTHYKLHRKGGKPVTYVQGDQFAPETWDSIETRFNFIFSDGVHSGRAVLDEMDHLTRRDLLDTSGKFAMYWDDMVNGEMQSAFERNARQLNGAYGLHWIHGTYGEQRLNGVFSTDGRASPTLLPTTPAE